MNKRNRPALGFLLMGIGLAGRALLAVPETVSVPELSMTVISLLGFLLLAAFVPMACTMGQLVLELILCSTQAETGGVWLWLTPVLRQADLWLLVAACCLGLFAAKQRMEAETFAAKTVWPPRLSLLLLGAQTLAMAAAKWMPANPTLALAATVLFVAFSVSLLWFTVLFLQCYNALRIKK